MADVQAVYSFSFLNEERETRNENPETFNEKRETGNVYRETRKQKRLTKPETFTNPYKK